MASYPAAARTPVGVDTVSVGSRMAMRKAAFGSPWRASVEGSDAFVEKGALLIELE